MSSLHLHAGLSERRASCLTELLQRCGLEEWMTLACRRWERPDHGDFARWQNALRALPEQPAQHIHLDADQPEIGGADELDAQQQTLLPASLRELIPWRKGPFSLFGVCIDAEWQSFQKWNRVRPHLCDLQGKTILDAGCGNGYYLLRMAGMGARLAIGVDPGWLANVQFAAISRTLPSDLPAWIIPQRLEDLPCASFDVVFSMGVLYHQREPQEHLRRLRECLRPGGELVLETLICEDAPASGALAIEGRYANMRNVWMLLHPEEVLRQLDAAGFARARCVDRARTTMDEQRRTDWMPFHSLQDALDPNDPARTIEGHPAPVRGIFLAEAKSL